jgi:hypothetical protein
MINAEFISFFIFIFSFLIILRNFILVLGSLVQEEPKPIVYTTYSLIVLGCSLSYIITYIKFII